MNIVFVFFSHLIFLCIFISEFDKAELLLYEEVARMPPFERKTLILLGAQGVGRRTMKNRLIKDDPLKFGTPIARNLIFVLLLL